uniref:Ig-like domain-containing protein n=1 Tax=Canis lupus dingo TaxID=286419 RepID=A0A8C0L6R4_CANLU
KHLGLLELFLMHLGLCFPGSYEITGPNAVRGLVGGSLTVECCYASTWKTYSKWWCRGSIWRRCNILVQTTGSEQKVKKNKVSIRDNQKNFTFSVTMEELTETDTDIYWCGIEKSGTDLGVEVKVTIDPGKRQRERERKREREREVRERECVCVFRASSVLVPEPHS